MIIAVDFDGTIVEHMYPEIGKPIPHAIETLRRLQEAGNQLILWTVRSEKRLKEAVDFCKEQGINFTGINENPGQKYWSGSIKAYAHVYIDDAAFGCPLMTATESNRPMVDWRPIIHYLETTDTIGKEILRSGH